MVATGSTFTAMPNSRFSHALSAPKRSSPGPAPRRRPPPPPPAPRNGSPALEHLAHLVHRQPRARDRRAAPLARQQLVEVRQALGLLAIGAEQLYHRRRRIGAALATSTSSWSPEARRPEAGPRTPPASGDGAARLPLKLFRVDLVDGGEPQDELHRQRALVALDQVEIGRRDAEPFGHGRLGQAAGRADAADARPGEYLLFGHLRIFTRSLHLRHGAAQRQAFTDLTNLQERSVKRNTCFSFICGGNHGFFSPICTAM